MPVQACRIGRCCDATELQRNIRQLDEVLRITVQWLDGRELWELTPLGVADSTAGSCRRPLTCTLAESLLLNLVRLAGFLIQDFCDKPAVPAQFMT